MAARYYQGRDGRLYQVGQDSTPNNRMFVGADKAIFGGEALFGADAAAAQQQLAHEIALAKSTGGYVAGEQVTPPIGFYQILPFTQAVVAANTSVRIALRPQRTFRVDALVVDSLEGGFFTLDTWSVGQNLMFVGEGSVRCTVFSEAAAQRGLNLRGFTANQGTDINLTFTNYDDEAHTLSFMLCGPAMVQIG